MAKETCSFSRDTLRLLTRNNPYITLILRRLVHIPEFYWFPPWQRPGQVRLITGAHPIKVAWVHYQNICKNARVLTWTMEFRPDSLAWLFNCHDIWGFTCHDASAVIAFANILPDLFIIVKKEQIEVSQNLIYEPLKSKWNDSRVDDKHKVTGCKH